MDQNNGTGSASPDSHMAGELVPFTGAFWIHTMDQLPKTDLGVVVLFKGRRFPSRKDNTMRFTLAQRFE